MDLQKEIDSLKAKSGYSGKPQQWQYGFDLACRELAKTQAVPEGFVLIKDDTKTVVAIERMVEQQVEASGMDSRRLERLDGWKIIEAAVEAQEQK